MPNEPDLMLVAGTPAAISSPFFLTLVDSLGVRQVLRFGRIDYDGGGTSPPSRFALTATRDADTVRLAVDVRHVITTDRTFVVRVRDGKTEWVDVKTGLATGPLIEVFGDLRAGDEVATRGTDEIAAGTEVVAKPPPPPA